MEKTTGKEKMEAGRLWGGRWVTFQRVAFLSLFSPEPLRPLSRSPAFSCSGEESTEDLRLSGNSVAESFWIQLGFNNSVLQFATCLGVSCPQAGSGSRWLALLPCLPSFDAAGWPLWPVFWPPPSTLSLTLAMRVRCVSAGEWGAAWLPTPLELCWVSSTPLPPDSRHTPWRIPPPTGVSRENSKREQTWIQLKHNHIQNASHLIALV